MSIKSRTSYTFETGEHTFEIPFEFIDGSEILEISEDGLKAKLGVLDYDQDAPDPIGEFDEGDFYQFDASYIHYTSKPDIEEFKRIIRANPGRVFTISWAGDCYGNICIQEGPLSIKDTKGDPRTGENSAAEKALEDAGGYYIVPEDVTEDRRLQYVESTIESYSDWCNGEVYGVCVWTYERESTEDPWEDPDRDECWGYIGYEYAQEELESYFRK